jgi:hypothetical protein
MTNKPSCATCAFRHTDNTCRFQPPSGQIIPSQDQDIQITDKHGNPRQYHPQLLSIIVWPIVPDDGFCFQHEERP